MGERVLKSEEDNKIFEKSKVFEIFSGDIKKETRCDKMVEGVNNDLEYIKDVKMDGQLLRIGIEKK